MPAKGCGWFLWNDWWWWYVWNMFSRYWKVFRYNTPRYILLQKLEYYGIQGYALQWFKQNQTDRTQCVHLGNSLSDIKPISIGVPQGSVLGPILFLLYVNDLPQHIKNEQCNMFADDTIIYSSGQSISEIQSKLQMAIDSVIPWYESNRLAVNTEKSSVLPIGKKTQIRDNNLNIYINNVLVNETNCTKYLGFLLTLFYHGMCNVIIYVDIFLEKLLYCTE